MDKIIARGLVLYGCHGVFPEEKHVPQKFQVDAEIELDLGRAGIEDCLELTVDYGQVYSLIKDMVANYSYNLIETLAENICQVILNKFEQVAAVEVTVAKPDAPVEGEFDFFAVRIKRFR